MLMLALTATATLNGKTFTAAKQKDGSYIIKITGIKASQLGDEITISGNAGGDFTVKVSALAYVNSILNSSTYSDNQAAKNAMASLYYYYLRAIGFQNDLNNGQ